jgi:hypothetical protein
MAKATAWLLGLGCVTGCVAIDKNQINKVITTSVNVDEESNTYTTAIITNPGEIRINKL